MSIRTLNESISVVGQLQPSDFAAVSGAGFKAVINNRPDFEEPGQPTHAEMKEAAELAGLQYQYIPIPSASQTEVDIDAMRAAVEALPKPILAFCRSGTRSMRLYMLAMQS